MSKPTDWAAVADEYGSIDADLQTQKILRKPKEERLKELAEQLRAKYDAAHAGDAFTLQGSKFLIEIGPRRNERKILSMVKLYKAMRLKLEEFLKLCKITFDTVDARLSEDQQEGIVEKSQTGERPLKPVPIPQVKAA